MCIPPVHWAVSDRTADARLIPAARAPLTVYICGLFAPLRLDRRGVLVVSKSAIHRDLGIEDWRQVGITGCRNHSGLEWFEQATIKIVITGGGKYATAQFPNLSTLNAIDGAPCFIFWHILQDDAEAWWKARLYRTDPEIPNRECPVVPAEYERRSIR